MCVDSSNSPSVLHQEKPNLALNCPMKLTELCLSVKFASINQDSVLFVSVFPNRI